MMRDLLDEAGHARCRRERQTIAGLHVDAMGLPVLIAPLLTEVHHVTIVMQPYQPGAEIAVGDLRERPCGIDIVDRADPKIEHAIDRREKGDAPSIRADAYDQSAGCADHRWQGKGIGGRLGGAVRNGFGCCAVAVPASWEGG